MLGRDFGYLGSQDTFYVGNLKGVGRIYQQTLIPDAPAFQTVDNAQMLRQIAVLANVQQKDDVERFHER
ncbi:MAG: hypothetical protein CL600_12045, partial [Alteromonas sp.]|nr:hypothetical protein [Alteromonas sp.]